MRMKIKTEYIRTLLVCALLLWIFVTRASAGSKNAAVLAFIGVDCADFDYDSDRQYIVAIEGEERYAPEPINEEIIVNPGGKGEFRLLLTEPGNYHYLVYEKPGASKKIEYDDRVYEITVFVTQNASGELDYVVTACNAETGDKPDSIEFLNKVDSKGDGPTPTVTPDPGESDSSSHSESNVKTGDESNMGFLIIMAVVMVVVFIILFFLRKKDDNDENDK